MKGWLVFGLLSIGASAAMASFEMILALDSSNSVLRLDPENRVQLGRFGSGRLLNATAIALDQSANEAFILNQYGNGQYRITVMNYNTGEFRREWAIGALPNQIFDLEFVPGVGLFVPGGNSVRLYQTNGVLTRTYTTTGADFRSVSYGYLFQEVHGHVSTGSTTTWVAANGVVSGTTPVPANIRGITGRVGVSQGIAVSGSQDLRFFDFGSLLYGGPTTFIQMNAYWSTTYGHGDTVYVGGVSTAGTGAIMTFDTQMNRLSDPWVVTGSSTIVSMATVVAPEPGTMIALGAGMLALLRRRRRSN